MRKPPIDIFTFDILCDVLAFLPFKNMQLLSISCAKLLNMSQHLHKFSPLQIHRPYERRVLEKLSIAALDPGLEFKSAEFVFRQQSQTWDETSTAPITFLRKLEVENPKYRLPNNKLRIGYYHCEVDSKQHRNDQWKTKIDNSKLSKPLAEFMWLPNTAPPSDVAVIEHICLELVKNKLWASSTIHMVR